MTIGIDRFISLKWANYSLDVFASDSNGQDRYALLQSWLTTEIKGIETARKTSNQLKRLWFDVDMFQPLRTEVAKSAFIDYPVYRPILHYGMAINVFPLFRDVSVVIGTLSNLQGFCSRQQIHQRILEKYSNPISVPRAVDRVLQSLVDWGLIHTQKGVVSLIPLEVTDPEMVAWLIMAITIAQPGQKILLSDLSSLPELLGVTITNVRDVIRTSEAMHLDRDVSYLEVVALEQEKIPQSYN